MWAYSHAAFRVATLGPGRLQLEPGTVVVVTHRRETDVPVVAPPLYRRAALWRHRRLERRLAFAARDDMFLPGFFAGFPPDLPPGVRRLLFPVGVGRWLPAVLVYPIRSASAARLGELLRLRKEARLDDVLPAAEVEEFRARANARRLAPPQRVADVLRGEYADLLWRAVARDDPVAGAFESFWSRRAALAAGDFRALADVLRTGVLVVFPEGRPSPDGEIGPIQRGVAALVRRGDPAALVPVAVSYDALTPGRTRAVVAIGPPAPPPHERVDETMLSLLRRTMPLTCGQVVADLVTRGGRVAHCDAEAAVAQAVASARSDGRPVEPELLEPRRRRRRVEEAVAAAASRPADVAFLAREYRSARIGS